MGFTPTKIHLAKEDPELTVEELLQIEPCKDYTKTPIQMLDGIYVNQPKRFLPFAQEAKKIAEALKKEQDAAQWAGIPPEKLVQDSFIEQLNSLQALKQLAPLHAARDHLPKDICLLYTSPSPRDATLSRMPSSA